jgi:hypothetical protein
MPPFGRSVPCFAYSIGDSGWSWRSRQQHLCCSSYYSWIVGSGRTYEPRLGQLVAAICFITPRPQPTNHHQRCQSKCFIIHRRRRGWSGLFLWRTPVCVCGTKLPKKPEKMRGSLLMGFRVVISCTKDHHLSRTSCSAQPPPPGRRAGQERHRVMYRQPHLLVGR